MRWAQRVVAMLHAAIIPMGLNNSPRIGEIKLCRKHGKRKRVVKPPYKQQAPALARRQILIEQQPAL